MHVDGINLKFKGFEESNKKKKLNFIRHIFYIFVYNSQIGWNQSR